MAAISHLGFLVVNDVRFGIPIVNWAEEVSSYIILGGLVQKILFKMAAGGHSGFGPLAKNAINCARDMEAIF